MQSMAIPNLWAFMFGAEAMLGGLTLAGLPVVIHLLHRRRFKEVDWAAMEWLLAALRKQSKRLRVEQFLLLALRTLLIALIVLAMAKPMLTQGSVAASFLPADKPVTHTVLVFDNSMSMHFAPGNLSRWERAKRLAQQVLEDGGKGDLASVVVLGAPSTILVRDPSNNLQEVGKEIDGIRPQHGAAQLEPALDQVSSVLQLSRAVRKRVVLITDMQKTLWSSPEAKIETADFARKLQSVSKLAKEFIILDVGEANSPNSAVVQLEQVEPLAVVGQPTLFRAGLAQYGAQPRNDVLVDFLVEGQVEASQHVTLPAGGSQQTVVFPFTFRDPGERGVEVRVADDALNIDNRRHLGVRVRDALQVLLVDGQPSGEPFQSETDYLRVALAPDEGGLIRPTVRAESDLLEAKLDEWDVVLLCNVAQFTPAEAGVLRDYLRRGGSVGFLLGSQVNLQAYNQLLYDNGKGILPVRLTAIEGQAGKVDKAFNFDPLGYRHPLVAAFADNTNAGLVTAKTFRYVKVEAGVQADGSKRPITTALAYAGGDPAVLFADVERGKVAVVTTGADLDWNRWPISPSYLPVMQNLVKELVSHRLRRPANVVGEPILAPLPRAGFDVAASVAPPGGGPATPLRLEERDGVNVVYYPNTDLAGFYTVALGAPLNATWKLAVNPPASESDLSRLTADDLKSMFPGWQFSLHDKWLGERAPSVDGLTSEGSLHRQCLWLALAILFLETALAWRCGHHG